MKNNEAMNPGLPAYPEGATGLLGIIEKPERFRIMNYTSRFVGSERRK
jgi:hypothetical protein